ncbi:hypothetical protein DL96DRAFT_1647430, partial [Flagelloscypha sp. PMI_526]
FEVPDLLSETEEMRLTIVEGESTFDASAPEGLCISQHEPLRAWWSKYCDYHGVKFKKGDSFDDKRGAIASTPGCTRAELVDEGMAFHRTFRVPDSEKVTQSLPPSLGRFPMVTVSEFASRLPEHIGARGGFLIPMFNREAMWIRFCREESKKAAVKISVGGSLIYYSFQCSVNVLSGEIKTKSSPPEVQQDYVVSSKQPWLDGVHVSWVVRQFVVSQLGEGYTVEEQVAGTATEGGFQFDVFPELHRAPVDKVFLLRGSLPRKRLMPGVGLPNDGEYRQDVRTPIRFTGRVGIEYQGIQALPCQDPQWTYQEYRRRFDPSCTLHAVYKNREPEKFYKLSGIEPPKPNYAPGTLLVGGTGETAQQRKAAELAKYDQEAKMSGIAAGGKIIQKIYQDSDSPWGQRFHVHIFSPETWEKITGLLAPITPITPELYHLAALKSVSTLDNVKHQGSPTPTSSKLVDPEHPGQCSTHFGQAVTCVFRPCGHRGCPGCLGSAMMNGSKCPHCNALISNDDSEPDGPHWSVSVIEELAQQTRDRATVEFISYDPRERVSPLLGGPAGK